MTESQESHSSSMSVIERLRSLFNGYLFWKQSPIDNLQTSAEEIVQAIGPTAASLVTAKVGRIIERILSGDHVLQEEAVEELVALVIRAHVTFPGDSPQAIFLALFQDLRAFMEGRHRPFVNSLFDAACRSIDDMEEQKRVATRIKVLRHRKRAGR